MASIEEIDQLDSGMGSSDARSPEVKSLLPDEEDDEEVLIFYYLSMIFNLKNNFICYYNLISITFIQYSPSKFLF